MTGRLHEDFDRAESSGTSDRSFGLTVGGFLLIVGLLPARRGAPVRVWALAAGAVLCLAALVWPSVLRSANRLWMKFGELLGKIMTPVFMAVLFYVVVTPYGAVLRLFGHDALRLRGAPKENSYWLSRRPPGPAPESMVNQF
jgi:hypothetical protein